MEIRPLAKGTALVQKDLFVSYSVPSTRLSSQASQKKKKMQSKPNQAYLLLHYIPKQICVLIQCIYSSSIVYRTMLSSTEDSEKNVAPPLRKSQIV